MNIRRSLTALAAAQTRLADAHQNADDYQEDMALEVAIELVDTAARLIEAAHLGETGEGFWEDEPMRNLGRALGQIHAEGI